MKQINHSHADTGAHAHAPLYVLIACEESQAECLAFRNLGHIAFSCDVQMCRLNPDWHILGDVTPYLQGALQFTTQSGVQMKVPRWDLIICHPPCTFLCNVSRVHLICRKQNPKRWAGNSYVAGSEDEFSWSNDLNAWLNTSRYRKMLKAREFFFQCLDAKAPYVAVENPLPMKLANLPKPSCYVCPSWFGVKYSKKTLYWLKNLPPIVAQIDFPNPLSYVRSSRGKYRSRTFPQLAEAIARQWSAYILRSTMI